VKSDTGFIVKIRPFEGYAEYREGDRAAIVAVQPVIGQALVHIYKDTVVKWQSLHHTEIISEEKRKEILENVAAAMRFRKCPVEMV
jgi:hypothetical protein